MRLRYPQLMADAASALHAAASDTLPPAATGSSRQSSMQVGTGAWGRPPFSKIAGGPGGGALVHLILRSSLA